MNTINGQPLVTRARNELICVKQRGIDVDRERARRLEVERTLEGVRESMAEHFGVTIDVQEERE